MSSTAGRPAQNLPRLRMHAPPCTDITWESTLGCNPVGGPRVICPTPICTDKKKRKKNVSLSLSPYPSLSLSPPLPLSLSPSLSLPLSPPLPQGGPPLVLEDRR